MGWFRRWWQIDPLKDLTVSVAALDRWLVRDAIRRGWEP